jgi:hypothetical protein
LMLQKQSTIWKNVGNNSLVEKEKM